MPIVSLRPTAWFPNQPVSRKPLMRGWIHLTAAPLSLAAAIILVVLAPTGALKWASAVYLTASLVLFGVSATYHLFYWSPRATTVLRRLDHSNIFLLIAGTYTPLTVALLRGSASMILLSVVWGGALVGILVNLFWPSAPRWLSTLIYVVLGWVAVWYLPSFWQNGGPAVVWLIFGGGIFYTVGAVVYATKKPDLWPTTFGFHEIFHSFTVLAWASQCVAAYIAVL